MFTDLHHDGEWLMECQSDVDPQQSIILPLHDGIFAYQPKGAQEKTKHRSYGPQLHAPRCVIIFRKVLETVYKKCNPSAESLNCRYKKQNMEWHTCQQLQDIIIGVEALQLQVSEVNSEQFNSNEGKPSSKEENSSTDENKGKNNKIKKHNSRNPEMTKKVISGAKENTGKVNHSNCENNNNSHVNDSDKLSINCKSKRKYYNTNWNKH